MVGEPSRALPDADFALGGRDFQGDTGNARPIGDIPFNVFARAISAARVNLCITRRSHATVYASSSCRPFELASAGAAIVSNPYNGLERWFEPGSELLIVEDADAGDRGVPRRCSPIPARRRRWAAARASACSTSTPIATARASCSRSSTCRCRREEDRDRARVQRAGRDRRGGRRAPRLRSRVRRARRRRRLARRDRRDARARTARASSRCRSTSASAARCRPAFATPRSTATSSRPASTATASTTRPSCAPLIDGGRPRRCRHLRRLAVRRGRGLPLLALAARRDPHSRAHRLAADRPARDRHDQRLPGARPQGDRALRRRLSARLSRGRGGADAAQAPAPPDRAAGADARAHCGTLVDPRRCASSTTWRR